MNTHEMTTKIKARKSKKAEVKAKEPKALKTTTPKKATKTTKGKSGSRSGSKAESVLDLMKRKQGATLAEIAKATRLAGPQHSRIRQRSRHEEARAQGGLDEERSWRADVPDRVLVEPFSPKPPWAETRPRGGLLFQEYFAYSVKEVTAHQFQESCSLEARCETL